MGQTTTANATLMTAGRIVPQILADFLTPNVDGTLNVTAVILDKKKLRFSATIPFELNGSPVTYTIANANGKERVFSDVDSIVRLAQKIVPAAQKVVVSIDDTDSLNPSESLGDPIAGYNRAREAFIKANQITEREKLKAETALTAIAGFAQGSPAQQAKFQDVQAQVDTLTRARTFYLAEITRYGSLANPPQ